MPELPDIQVYIEALERRVLGARLERLRLHSPFVLRTVQPAVRDVEGQHVRTLRRLGKRIVLGLDSELFLVLHLMIAGRLGWRQRGAGVSRKVGLAAFDFATGTLLLTEASSRKRAALHILRGEADLQALDPGGLEVLDASGAEFSARLQRDNHTLKRALSDPHILSGIGNAYSDEILHRAGLSPLKRTRQMSPAEFERLFSATQATLRDWIERLRAQAGDNFPQRVTAFRPEMAVHGRYRQPCPTCGRPVQRIRYAENECNYCAQCQTGGRLLADRALSRLLREDWPRTLEELEERQRPAPQ